MLIAAVNRGATSDIWLKGIPSLWMHARESILEQQKLA
jgi:hypothetical protein